jgi:hypothetical protein
MTTKQAKEQLNWLERTLCGIAGAIGRAVFTEEHARKPGWLQGVDPRAKLGYDTNVSTCQDFWRRGAAGESAHPCELEA